jgi:hypothetical protein
MIVLWVESRPKAAKFAKSGKRCREAGPLSQSQLGVVEINKDAKTDTWL